jgi:hypothetical protein
MTELSENIALSQRAVYADVRNDYRFQKKASAYQTYTDSIQMFGFKNTLSNFNHNEIAAHRSRLFSLILSVRGKGHLRQVSPYLHKRMEIFVENELSPRPATANGRLMPFVSLDSFAKVLIYGRIYQNWVSRYVQTSKFPSYGGSFLWRKTR